MGYFHEVQIFTNALAEFSSLNTIPLGTCEEGLQDLKIHDP